MKIIEEDIARLKALVENGPGKIVIVSHTNPDGDAIGSSLAWGAYLTAKGHEVTIAVPNRYPYFLEWMPGISSVKILKDDKDKVIASAIAGADIIFCLDFNMISRLEGLGELIASNNDALYVLIDHHMAPPDDFDLVFSYVESSSTSYLVYELIREIDGTGIITEEMGECLYTGMMTDTGNFAFSNLTAGLFEAVAVLVRKGMDIPRIYANVYNNFTLDRVKLLGYALDKMKTFKAGKVGVAYMTLSEAEMRRFGFQQGDSEGFVNYPLTVRDLSLSAIFIETRQFIRVSLRSRGDVDVNDFAKRYFEGGGHRNASGGKSHMPMTDTVAYFHKCVGEFLETDRE